LIVRHHGACVQVNALLLLPVQNCFHDLVSLVYEDVKCWQCVSVLGDCGTCYHCTRCCMCCVTGRWVDGVSTSELLADTQYVSTDSTGCVSVCLSLYLYRQLHLFQRAANVEYVGKPPVMLPVDMMLAVL